MIGITSGKIWTIKINADAATGYSINGKSARKPTAGLLWELRIKNSAAYELGCFVDWLNGFNIGPAIAGSHATEEVIPNVARNPFRPGVSF